MKNDKFKDTLKKHFNKKGTYAFIVGNGINRAYSNDNSWSKLLKILSGIISKMQISINC